MLHNLNTKHCWEKSWTMVTVTPEKYLWVTWNLWALCFHWWQPHPCLTVTFFHWFGRKNILKKAKVRVRIRFSVDRITDEHLDLRWLILVWPKTRSRREREEHKSTVITWTSVLCSAYSSRICKQRLCTFAGLYYANTVHECSLLVLLNVTPSHPNVHQGLTKLFILIVFTGMGVLSSDFWFFICLFVFQDSKKATVALQRFVS